MECYNCTSINLIETEENLTCLDCSRVQSDIIFGERSEERAGEIRLDSFILEYGEREALSRKDQIRIANRLEAIKSVKSVFSKLELSISLIYMNSIEEGCVRSPQAFCRTVGDLVTVKRLNMAVKFLRKKLKNENDDMYLEWSALIEPFCRRYIFLKSDEVNYLKHTCDRLRIQSNMSIFSVAAVSFLVCFVHFRKCDFLNFLSEISRYSKISKSTLKRNCIKFSDILPTFSTAT